VRTWAATAVAHHEKAIRQLQRWRDEAAEADPAGPLGLGASLVA
jgi:hypothetical protein